MKSPTTPPIHFARIPPKHKVFNLEDPIGRGRLSISFGEKAADVAQKILDAEVLKQGGYMGKKFRKARRKIILAELVA